MSTVPSTPQGPPNLRVTLAVVFAFIVLLPVALGALDAGDLRCAREARLVRCDYVKSLLGIERDRRHVDAVIGARVEFSPAKKGSGTYRPVLLTRAGEAPLSSSFNYNQGQAESLAERVSLFVQGSEPLMQLSQPGWGWPVVLATFSVWLLLAWGLPRLAARQRTTDVSA